MTCSRIGCCCVNESGTKLTKCACTACRETPGEWYQYDWYCEQGCCYLVVGLAGQPDVKLSDLSYCACKMLGGIWSYNPINGKCPEATAGGGGNPAPEEEDPITAPVIYYCCDRTSGSCTQREYFCLPNERAFNSSVECARSCRAPREPTTPPEDPDPPEPPGEPEPPDDPGTPGNPCDPPCQGGSVCCNGVCCATNQTCVDGVCTPPIDPPPVPTCNWGCNWYWPPGSYGWTLNYYGCDAGCGCPPPSQPPPDPSRPWYQSTSCVPLP